MEKLNQTIKELEIKLFNDKNKENDLRKKVALDRLRVNDNLDSKNPTYSNQQKRDVFIELDPIVIEGQTLLKELSTKIAMDEIELHYLLRKFEIGIHHDKSN